MLIRFSDKKIEEFLRATFNQNTMENLRDVTRNEDTCVIALIMFYEIKKPNKSV